MRARRKQTMTFSGVNYDFFGGNYDFFGGYMGGLCFFNYDFACLLVIILYLCTQKPQNEEL